MCANPGSAVASSTLNYINANSCTDFSYAFPTPQPATGLNNWQYGYYTQAVPGAQLILDPSSFQTMSPTPAYDSNGNLIPNANAGFWSQNFYQYWTAMDAFEAHSNASYTDLHQPPYCNQSLYQDCGNGLAPNVPNSTSSGDYYATRRYIVPSNSNGPTVINLSVEKDPRTVGPSAQGDTEYIYKISDGVQTFLGCINVQVNGSPNPNVTYPTCSTPVTTPDPLMSGQPIYSASFTTTTHAGDFIDVIQVPNYNNAIPVGNSTAAGSADFSSAVFQLETIQSLPEPATFGMIGVGLLLAGFARRRANKRA
jgi:hypothetical protein